MRTLGLFVLISTLAACAGEIGDDGNSPVDESQVTNPPSSPDPTEACFKQRNEVLQALQQLAETRAGACASDSDCTLVSLSIPCQSSCHAAVLKSRESEAIGAISDYAKSVCPTLPTTCGIGPQCAAPKGAACLNGTCVVSC